jgi:hypothetical protein
MKTLTLRLATISLGLTALTLAFMSPSAHAEDFKTKRGLEVENYGCGNQKPIACTSADEESGLYVENEKTVIQHYDDGTIVLNLATLNATATDGFIEVYDSSNQLEDVHIIDGYKSPEGVVENSQEVWKIVSNVLSGSYSINDLRTKLNVQNFRIKLLPGSYVKITKSSNFAKWYNTAMLALEVSQLPGKDNSFLSAETTKSFLARFSKEFASTSVINIFKSEPSRDSALKLEFMDKDKLGEVFKKILTYAATESDPNSNPILSAYAKVNLKLANEGLEKAIDAYIFPGLGQAAKAARVTSEVLNTSSKAIDLFNIFNFRKNGTVTFKNGNPKQYLTENDIKQVRKEYEKEQQHILKSVYRDSRSLQERQQIEQFEALWKKNDPTITPFIGSWGAIEETTTIYPTNTKGRVCVVDTFMPSSENNPDSGFRFRMGSVVNGQIQDKQSTLIREGGLLVSIGVHQGKVNSYPYAYPRAVSTIEDSFPLKIKEQINKNGCISFRKSQQITLTESYVADKLADGLHRLCLPNKDTCFNFRKTGSQVIGSFVNRPLSMCIDGRLKGNTITGFGVLRESQTSRSSVNLGDEFQGTELQEFAANPSLKIARSTTISIPLGSKEPISYGVWRKYNSLILNLKNYVSQTSESHIPDGCKIE